MMEKELSRYHCVTTKLETQFGSLFHHIDIDDNNIPRGDSFSYSQKLEASAVGKTIDAMARFAGKDE